MSINLIVEPNVSPVTWEDFVAKYPKNSIALDGYVIGESKSDLDKNMFNINHHENVNRLSYNCTCQQILTYIRMGFLDCFRDSKGALDMNIYVNAADEDVCLSWFLLNNSNLAENSVNPNLNRLVSVENYLDMTSGTYPIHKDSIILRELAYVFDPFYISRDAGVLNIPEMCKGVILTVESRIMNYILGRSELADLDTKYEIIGGGKDWKLVTGLGRHARTAMMSDGITCYVTVRQRTYGGWDYVLGKKSPFIKGFDIETMFVKLNEIEECTTDRWGGNSIIGGSPRVGGSKLDPEQLENILNTLMKGE